METAMAAASEVEASLEAALLAMVEEAGLVMALSPGEVAA